MSLESRLKKLEQSAGTPESESLFEAYLALQLELTSMSYEELKRLLALCQREIDLDFLSEAEQVRAKKMGEFNTTVEQLGGVEALSREQRSEVQQRCQEVKRKVSQVVPMGG